MAAALIDNCDSAWDAVGSHSIDLLRQWASRWRLLSINRLAQPWSHLALIRSSTDGASLMRWIR